MPTNPKDARLRELQFLAKLERLGQWNTGRTLAEDSAFKQMVVHLLQEGYVNGPSTVTVNVQNDVEKSFYNHRQGDLRLAMQDQDVLLRINHPGRLRLSELQQALQTGRDREHFSILLSKRHIEPDLAIALASTSPTSPLSVAYLDANGFKAINDGINHAAGDEALKTYMSVVLMLTEGRGEAYRDGGDEVVVIMPQSTTEQASQTMRAVAIQLHKEKMPGDLRLSLSCGIATTTDANLVPEEFLKAADEQQKRAKERSRTPLPRPSVIAVMGEELEAIPLVAPP